MSCSWQWIDSGSAGFPPWLHWAGASSHWAPCVLPPRLRHRNMPGATVSCLHTAYWIWDRDNHRVNPNLGLCSDSNRFYRCCVGRIDPKQHNNWAIREMIKKGISQLSNEIFRCVCKRKSLSQLTASVEHSFIVSGSFIYSSNNFLSLWPYKITWLKERHLEVRKVRCITGAVWVMWNYRWRQQRRKVSLQSSFKTSRLLDQWHLARTFQSRRWKVRPLNLFWSKWASTISLRVWEQLIKRPL